MGGGGGGGERNLENIKQNCTYFIRPYICVNPEVRISLYFETNLLMSKLSGMSNKIKCHFV